MNNPKKKKKDVKDFENKLIRKKNGGPSFWSVQLLDVTPLDFFSC